MTNKAWQSDIEDLIKYLGKYVEDEIEAFIIKVYSPPRHYKWEYSMTGWIREGIEAFESINGVSVCVMPALGVSDEAPAEEERDVRIKAGDVVEVMDLAGNTVVSPASEVEGVSEYFGKYGDMHQSIRTKRGGIVWYSAEHYQLIKCE